MKNHVYALTTKIPHHSHFSGYELLIRYLKDVRVQHFDRGSSNHCTGLLLERALRRISVSRWYQWDGVRSEFFTLSKLLQPQSLAHFLYGDTTIGLLPYFRPFLSGKLALTIHATPDDLSEILQFPHWMKEADHLILLGENQRDFFTKLGIEDEKMSVIPHGVDTDFFKPVSFKPIQSELHVLMVGNWKRNFSLYESIIKQTQDLPVVYHIVTPDFNHAHFRSLKNVKLYTGISDESLRAMYQLTDVLLMGLTDSVANNVLLEAAACALPIICEDVGAVTSYLDDSCVEYVYPNDIRKIISLLRAILENRNILLPKAEKAFRQVQRYSWPLIAEKTQELYQQLLK